MRARLRYLYRGKGTAPTVFRSALFLFDIATIAYFLMTATARLSAPLIAIDLAIAVVIACDVAARFAITQDRRKFLLSLSTAADLVVLVSMLAPIATGSNLGFLRVLRVLRLMRSFHVVGQLDRWSARLDVNTRVVTAAANLIAFIFVVTSIVYVLEHERNENVETYIDALYFTVTTLTTTGYGDITLEDRWGRVLTIFIMVFGVGFFLQLIQAIYRPNKVEVTCETCGLSVHERDASHCKHCGEPIRIETEGQS